VAKMAERKRKAVPAKKSYTKEQLKMVTDLLDWWLPRCFDPDAPVASAKTSVEIVLKLMGYKGDLLASMEEQDNKKGSQFVSLLQELTGDDTA
jgi:hypothetical protein